MENYVVGTCKTMCPEREVILREKEKLLHPFEYRSKNKKGLPIADRSKMVKEFSRAAAGRFVPNQTELRPPEVLLKTVEYLLGNLISVELERGTLWIDIYEYIFDRLRAVRQDLVIQNIEGPVAISILEKTIRFLLYSGYCLCEEKPSLRFDPVINDTHLQECLVRLLTLYKEGQKCHCSNRLEFESLYQIVNLGKPAVINYWYSLEQELRTDPKLKLVYRASIAYYLNNYYRVLKLYKRLPSIQLQWAFHRHLTSIYKKVMEIMSVAYNSKLCKYPVPKLTEFLAINSDSQTVSLCRHFSVSVSNDNNIVFQKNNFQENNNSKFLLKRSFILDRKFDRYNLKSLFLYGDPR